MCISDQWTRGLCSSRERQECPSVESQTPTCLKNSTENVHQISLTLLKVEVWGVGDMHYFDLDLGPMTLELKLDLDIGSDLLAC